MHTQYLSDAGARVVLCSHMGRPKGQVNEAMRLAPVAQRLADLISKPGTCISVQLNFNSMSIHFRCILALEDTSVYMQNDYDIRDSYRDTCIRVFGCTHVNAHAFLSTKMDTHTHTHDPVNIQSPAHIYMNIHTDKCTKDTDTSTNLQAYTHTHIPAHACISDHLR